MRRYLTYTVCSVVFGLVFAKIALQPNPVEHGSLDPATVQTVVEPEVEQTAVAPEAVGSAPDLIPDPRPREPSVAEKIARGDAAALRLKQKWTADEKHSPGN